MKVGAKESLLKSKRVGLVITKDVWSGVKTQPVSDNPKAVAFDVNKLLFLDSENSKPDNSAVEEECDGGPPSKDLEGLRKWVIDRDRTKFSFELISKSHDL